jgi:hypothetical protein
VTDTDITLPLTGDAALLAERYEHQVTLRALERALEEREQAEVDAALWHAIALRALGVMAIGPQSIEQIVAGVNSQLARELIAERRGIQSPLDRVALAVAGRPAAAVNAELRLEDRAYPSKGFDPAGGHS